MVAHFDVDHRAPFVELRALYSSPDIFQVFDIDYCACYGFEQERCFVPYLSNVAYWRARLRDGTATLVYDEIVGGPVVMPGAREEIVPKADRGLGEVGEFIPFSALVRGLASGTVDLRPTKRRIRARRQ
jgi:hypothetical protein